MDKEKTKIFLSYAREDMGMARQFYSDMKRYRLDSESLFGAHGRTDG